MSATRKSGNPEGFAPSPVRQYGPWSTEYGVEMIEEIGGSWANVDDYETLKREHKNLWDALQELVNDEWRVCCDYGPYEERAAILKRAEDALSNSAPSSGGGQNER
jgi:hypothetical protein